MLGQTPKQTVRPRLEKSMSSVGAPSQNPCKDWIP